MEAVKLSIFHNQEESTQKPRMLFIDFTKGYLSRCHRTERYKLMYQNTMNHVVGFSKFYDIPEPYTNTIDMEFCENFVFYLRSEKQLMQNTVKGHLERVHAMVHKAALYGYPVNNTYEEVTVEEEETSGVFLSMIEITRIYYYESLTRFQREVRDHFILGCLTGLRYSDYSRMNESNFSKDTNIIAMKTKKTGVVISVPAHRFVREILRKYDYKLPKPRCIQYFNRAIKDICQKVGLNDIVLWERTVGTEVVRREIPKWELIASHTARRSFATNMFLQNIPTYRIMLITGHKSEKSFFKYIRVSREENAATLSGHLFFQ